MEQDRWPEKIFLKSQTVSAYRYSTFSLKAKFFQFFRRLFPRPFPSIDHRRWPQKIVLKPQTTSVWFIFNFFVRG